MSEPEKKTETPWTPSCRGWVQKFADAFRGIAQGMAGQNSFIVHLLATVAVIVLAAYLQVSLERWCLLILCIGIVLAAELFNSSLEWICRSVTGEHDPNIDKALNIASGAVLVVALAAAIVGAIVFINALI